MHTQLSTDRYADITEVQLTNSNIELPNARPRTRPRFDSPKKRSSKPDIDSWGSSRFLPATVAETDHVDSEKSETSESLHLLDTQNDRAMEMMDDTQGINDESTQPISQSLYRSIIQKGRSLMSSHVNVDERQDVGQEEAADTQRTFEPGDLGHVDIMSSFVTGQIDTDDMQRFERVDFSPTQSQHNLTQFPESQRFKTPATAGKKRDANGEPIESPMLPRNPLRGELLASESDKVMGLSQAFAGTQAGSSPFTTNGLLTDLRSDRPSPNVELQTRPVAATSSSPLRPLSEARRTIIEPASKYVSVRQSQAERERQVRPTLLDDDDTDHEFGEEPAYIIQARRQKQRRDRVNEDLKRLSSPIVEPEPEYSRINSDETQISVVDEQVGQAGLDAHTVGRQSRERHDSEVETEQENEYIGSSLPASPNEDDKENQIVDVPRTVTSNRLQNFIGVTGSSSRIDASLSVHTTPRVSQTASMPSSAFQDVPNSQPGDDRRRQLVPAKAISTSRRAISPDPLHASMPITMQTPLYAEDHNHVTTIQGNTTEIQIEDLSSADTAIPAQPRANGSEPLTAMSETPQPAKHSSEVLSHASHSLLQPPTQSNMTLTGHLTVSPVTRLPMETRRGRLMDISAEASPSRSAPAFDANQALGLDQDSEHAAYFLPDALRSPMRTPKRRRLMRTHGSDEVDEGHVATASGDVVFDDTRAAPPTSSSDMLAYSQEIVLPRPQRLLTRSTNSGPQSSGSKRASVWDFEVSPQKSMPKANERKKMPPRANLLPKVRTSLPEDTTKATTEEQSQLNPCRVIERNASATIPESDLRESSDRSHAPNMVFACFNGKTRAYYPAICLGIASEEPKRYQIQWEGYDPDEVDAYGVRPLDLQIGDSVKVNLAGIPKIPFVVQGFKDVIGANTTDLCDVRGFQTLNVTPKHRKDMSDDRETHDIDVPVKAIYLDSNMWGQLKDRVYDFVPTTRIEPTGYATPVDRSITPTTPSSRRRTAPLTMSTSLPVVKSGLFANMAFAVSYEDQARKDSLVKQIQQNGGVVLGDSFPEMLETDKTELRVSHRHLGFTVLLTESYSRKEKYIQALALGLPCLSGRWIEASIEFDALQDWRDYLLPAGESAELDGAVRSRILTAFPATTISLSEMLDTRPMMLQDASVIVITGRGKVEMRSTKYIFMIRALGASRVERVLDIKAAQQLLDAESSFQWIFVDDKDLATSQSTLILDRSKGLGRGKQHSATKSSSRRRCQIVSHDFIVQSLILGHLIRS